jgi:hypothetical protein
MASLAQMERELLAERTRAGLDAARRRLSTTPQKWGSEFGRERPASQPVGEAGSHAASPSPTPPASLGWGAVLQPCRQPSTRLHSCVFGAGGTRPRRPNPAAGAHTSHPAAHTSHTQRGAKYGKYGKYGVRRRVKPGCLEGRGQPLCSATRTERSDFPTARLGPSRVSIPARLEARPPREIPGLLSAARSGSPECPELGVGAHSCHETPARRSWQPWQPWQPWAVIGRAAPAGRASRTATGPVGDEVVGRSARDGERPGVVGENHPGIDLDERQAVPDPQVDDIATAPG